MKFMKSFKKTITILWIIWGIYTVAFFTKIIDKIPENLGLLVTRSYMAVFTLLILLLFIFGIFAIKEDAHRKENPRYFWLTFIIYFILGAVFAFFFFANKISDGTGLGGRILFSILASYFISSVTYYIRY